MDPSQFLANIGDLLLRLALAALVFFIGWIIAKIIAALVRRLMAWLRIDERVGKATSGSKVPKLENIVTQATYYLILLFAAVAALQVLGLTIITEPLNALMTSILAWIPRIIAGIAVIIVAWIVASILRGLTRRILDGVNFDRRLGDSAGVTDWPLSRAVSEVVYWLVWLLFLPIIFAGFGLEALIAPVMTLLADLLGWIPNLIVAALIMVVGLFLARIVQRIVANFFAALGTDRLAARFGLTRYMGKQTLSGLLGLLVFVIVLIPIITAALSALQLASLTAPLTEMLTAILVAIPVIIIAAAIIIVAFFIGRAIGDFVANFLEGLGFDNILARLGLARPETAIAPTTSAVPAAVRTPSRVAGALVTLAVVLMAALSAFSLLGLDPLAVLLSQFIVFAWKIVIGVLIFGIGLWIATWLSRFILGSNWPRKHLLAVVARIAVIVLSLSMALSQMGLADSIITLAFGVPLLGVALAIGLAFGLGGREVAASQLQSWQTSVKDVDAQLAAQAAEAAKAEAAAATAQVEAPNKPDPGSAPAV